MAQTSLHQPSWKAHSFSVLRLINTMGCPSPSQSCPFPSPHSLCIREISALQKRSSCWNNYICAELIPLLKSLASIKQRQPSSVPSVPQRGFALTQTSAGSLILGFTGVSPSFLFQSVKWSGVLFADRSVSESLPGRVSQAGAGEAQTRVSRG